MVASLLVLATPTIGPPPNTWLFPWPLARLLPPCVEPESCEAEVPLCDASVALGPDPLDAPLLLFDVPGEVPEAPELLKPPPIPPLEPLPNPPLEFPPKALFELPPNPDDCPNADPPVPEPNPEPPAAEPFICPTVFAPAMVPPPMLPVIDTSGSP